MSGSALRETPAAAPAAIAPVADEQPMMSYTRYAPGEGTANTRPGDIVLVRGEGWLGRAIRAFVRIRCRRLADRPLAHWSHAAIIVSSGGYLVEVVHTGVVLSNLEKYRGQEYHYVHLNLSAAERTSVTQYAHSCLRQNYGRWSFFLLALAVLTGDWFEVPDRGQQGCVALIARALQRAGVTFARRPADMTPADLAKQFGVMP
jgi:hypothetical protein